MSRMIEFRAKSAFDNNWRYGYIIKTRKGNFAIVDDEETFSLVSENTIGQYTGMKDKNGKKIYEGDIVEAWSEGVKAIGKVKQRKDGLWLIFPAWQSGRSWFFSPDDNGKDDVEIVGNIYDNPELIERKED